MHKDLYGQQQGVGLGHQQGLGIGLAGSLELDASNQPLCLHHSIAHVDPSGPVGARGIIRIGDELLEVNGRAVRGIKREEAWSIVKDTPTVVRLVICRPIRGEDDEPDRGLGNQEEMEESESANFAAEGGAAVALNLDDASSDHAPQEIREGLESFPKHRLPLPAIDYLAGDFTRRFERQSWRERHEKETQRIKLKFEVRCMRVCMYVCMYDVCMYVCMYVCTHVCMYVHMYVCVYIQ